MNRMALIAVALCAVLLVPVGAAAGATQEKLAPQYRVVQFDVTTWNAATHQYEVAGRLSINMNERTFVLNARGLQPGTEYYFYCLGAPLIDRATANEDGDLHLTGVWDRQDILILQPPSSEPLQFTLRSMPIMGGYFYDYDSVLTAKVYYGLFRSTFWGTLKGADGTPLPYQQLAIEVDGWTWFHTTTGADGSFRESHSDVPRYVPCISSSWTSYNGTTYGPTWVNPVSVPYLPT